MKEAKRLSIPVFAMVDTCCDPTDIDYVIPANDDATKSIAVVLEAMCAAIAEGTEERKLEKEKEAQEADAEGATVKKEGKPRIKKAVKAAIDAEEAAVAEVVAAVELPTRSLLPLPQKQPKLLLKQPRPPRKRQNNCIYEPYRERTRLWKSKLLM